MVPSGLLSNGLALSLDDLSWQIGQKGVAPEGNAVKDFYVAFASDLYA